MSYLTDARKRLDAIKLLAAGKPNTHVYSVTRFGKVCVGCGQPKLDATLRCDGNLYADKPERLLQFKLAALAILQLEVSELISRLALSERALEAAKLQHIRQDEMALVRLLDATLTELRAPPEDPGQLNA